MHTSSKRGAVSMAVRRRQAYAQLVLPKIAAAHASCKRSSYITLSNNTDRKIT
eukprot:SAG31_NODE_18773_length_623_cov_1.020992_1_plen_52_part_10